MNNLLNLTPKPTTDEEVRQSIIKVLQDTLQEAERGEIEGLLMVVCRPDETWQPRISETGHISAVIGKIEIAKWEYIQQYVRSLGLP